jgi:hypothetical protein
LDYLDRKPNAAEVHRTLEREFGPGAVSVRWIQALVDLVWTEDPSEPWTIGDAGSDDPTFILPTLGWLLSHTVWRPHLRRGEARWVARVQRVAPDLHPEAVFFLARMYLARQEREEPTTDIDAYLALGPWRSEEAFTTYLDAVRDHGLERWPLMPGDVEIMEQSDGAPIVREVSRYWVKKEVSP